MKERGAVNQETNSEPARKVTTGMRGGMGRTLLTAFLMLAVVPLSVVGYMAVRYANQDSRRCALNQLENLATYQANYISYLLCQTSASPDLTPDDCVITSTENFSVLDEAFVMNTTAVHVKNMYIVDTQGHLLWTLYPTSSLPIDNPVHDRGVNAALQHQNGASFYKDHLGEQVAGAYRWLPGLQTALIMEQAAASLLGARNNLAAVLVGSTLAVALLTTLLAAVVTRQITRPLVNLTVSAVKIAGGDLTQRVRVNRRDEIGILAQAFNVMTAELRDFYYELERKVADRTEQLRFANTQLSYQANQLYVSAQIGQVATSILDLEELLSRVVALMRDNHDLVYVAIYLLDDIGETLTLRATAGDDMKPDHALKAELFLEADNIVSRAALEGTPQEWTNEYTRVAIPLRQQELVNGVLYACRSYDEAFSAIDVLVWESLGDQISVAIKNAQTYGRERAEVERLRRLEHLHAQSLGSISYQLATALNTIIGFSRLMLKELDGPLTETQRTDLKAIHASGQHLQQLLDNVAALSEREETDSEMEKE